MPRAFTPAAGLKGFRRLAQLGFLAVLGQWSFYGIFRCPFIIPYVSCQNCPVITCHGRLLPMFWGFWILLPLSVVAFGRAFCGWACPGGLVSQLLGRAAPLKTRTRNAFLRILPRAKYLGLAAALGSWWFLGQSRENVPIRTGEFFSAVALTFEHANPAWLFRTFFVLAFLALGLVLAGAWCRFACPTGGLLELLKPFAMLGVFKDEKCDDCDLCLKGCEMGTRPAEANCTSCGDCLNACPQDAIHFGHPRRNS
ncbi:MAG: 4Fe-4S binding protein [Acidobacteria bacterium]|nr:4Fe-4S binding protein [Acidobacteriota bacterium]